MFKCNDLLILTSQDPSASFETFTLVRAVDTAVAWSKYVLCEALADRGNYQVVHIDHLAAVASMNGQRALLKSPLRYPRYGW